MEVSFNQIGSFQGAEGGPNVLANPTSLAFGPDGRLYVSEQNGSINAFEIVLEDGEYKAVSHEQLEMANGVEIVKSIQNHDDDGSISANTIDDIENRQVTGIVVTGTEDNPVLYISSSDPRIANNGEVNIDTNSGVVTRATWNGSSWDTVDIIRGLPRSEENHAVNGLALSPDGETLYLQVGGHTNNGAPSAFFSYTAEYALSGALLAIDLPDIESRPILTDPIGGQGGTPRDYIYDLPTLDDPNTANDGVREDANGLDTAGPWGGNDGLNQAILPADAPLSIYADGFRNQFDIVVTEDGQLYTVDNGSNGNLGDVPNTLDGEAVSTPNNGGSGDPEPLFLIEEGGYYGHANPVRSNQNQAWTVYNDSGNPDGTLTVNSVPDISALVPEGVLIPDGFIIDPSKFTGDAARLLQSGVRVSHNSAETLALATVGSSSNGLVEYTGDAFDGAIQGALIVAQFNGNLTLLNLNEAGDALEPLVNSGADGVLGTADDITQDADGIVALTTGLSLPLDVTVGPNGTLFAAELGGNAISIYAPSDLVLPDDPDFDNDGLLNTVDAFIRDASNGSGVLVRPGETFLWDFDPNQDGNLPGPSGYAGGLTGVMVNGTTDFEQFFQEPSDDPDQDIKLDNVKFLTAAGGGTIVVENVSNGDAYQGSNSGEYLFHTGVTIAPSVETFTVKWVVFNPVEEITGTFQQIGGYIGTGDQSNYLKLVAIKDGNGSSGFEIALENDDATTETYIISADDVFTPADIPENAKITFELLVDPINETVVPTITYDTNDGEVTVSGDPLSIAGSTVLETINGDYQIEGQTSGLAVGLYSSNTNEAPADTFQAIFDEIEITATGDATATAIYRVNAGGPELSAIDGGPNWVADTGANNTVYLSDPGSNNATGFAAVEPNGDVPGSTPAALFDTERFDQSGGTEMSYAFDVTQSGFYEVRIYAGNGFAGTSGAGSRTFDVAIEGDVLPTLENIDLSAQFGHLNGGVITNIVEVTDGELNIEFIHGTENPLVNGIEILQLGAIDPDALTVSIQNASIDVNEGDVQAQVSLLTNATVPIGETVTINYEISAGSATGEVDFGVPGATYLAETQTYFGSVTIAGGSSDVTIPVTINDDADLENLETIDVSLVGVTANAQIGVGTGTINIIDNDAADGTILYRVNAGGAEVAAIDGGPAWSEDSLANNSPFLVNTGSNNIFSAANVDTSLITEFGVPADVIGVERFDTSDDASDGNMQYSFAVDAGTEVEVRLYIGELFAGLGDTDGSGDPTGDRIFDISVDGAVPAEFAQIDQYALTGDFLTATVISTRVTSDGSIDLEFIADIENPAIKAIEIVAVDDVDPVDPVDTVNGVTVPGGDLSSDPSAPTNVALVAGGTTSVVTNLAGNNADRDFITVDIPDGFRLVDVRLAGYAADQGNSAFFGLVAGDDFEIDPAIPALGVTPDGIVESGDLLGGIVFNEGNVGEDLLPNMNQPTFGFQGFDEDNLTGQLTFWVNQGGNASSAELEFVTEAIPADSSDVVVAINAGGQALTQDGIDFSADEGFLNGTPFSDGNGGNGQQPVYDGTVYETERFGGADGGELSYEIDVDPGVYTVELYFAEIYATELGDRVFDVTVEGVIVLDDFDILDATGGDINTPFVFTLTNAVSPDTFGNPDALDIDFSASADNAKISAIVVRDATVVPPSGGEATFSVNLNSDNVQISNFGNGSFVVTNTGTKKIANIEVDVTNALYPDSVFDPFGVAGDTTSKALTINGGSGTGVVSPTTYNPYIGSGGIDGFRGLSLIFDPQTDGGFEPGETVAFAVDMDPNSIAGSQKSILDSGTIPAWDVGGVSGAELIGSTFTITFEDGTTSTGQLSGADNQGGSKGIASQDSEGLVASLTVNGLEAGDVGNYSDGGPSVVVDGPAGETVRVVLTKGIIQPTENNFPEPYASQLDDQLAALAATDFPANNAAEFQTVDIVLTGTPQDISGLFNFDDVPGFDLPQNEGQLPLGFVASIIDPGNDDLPKGPVSDAIYTIFAANNAPVMDPIADVEIDEFGTASFVVSAADDDDDLLTLTVEVTRDSDGSVIDPADYTFTDNGDGSAAFSWTTSEPDDGVYTATVSASDGKDVTTQDVTLLVNEVAAPAAGTPLYRVNVGGPDVAAGDGLLAWAADTLDAPNENFVSSSGGAPSTNAAIDITDPSIPTAGVEEIFQTERFDFAGGAPLAYSFDVPEGTEVTVNLYFAETYTPIGDTDGSGDSTGDRIFDVLVDGTVPAVYDDIDQFAIAGAFNKGFVLSHTVVSDGAVDIVFAHGVAENTAVKAIEIVSAVAPDTNAPTATLTSDDVTAAADTYTFTVEFSDDTAIDVSSLDDLDVIVAGPGGAFTASATFVEVDIAADGATRVATYSITPPDGAWDETDNGDYTISLTAGEVSDLAGNTAAAEVLGGFNVDVQPTDQVDGGQLNIAVTPGAGLDSSTFAQGSFVLTNASAAGVMVTAITFDLSDSIFPDMVFDPTGAGGDAVASPFTPNAGAAATGLVVTADPSSDPFSQARNGGFDKLTVEFTDFNPGETFTFTTDIDPNSIQQVPGAGAAGSVSGYELIGATATVTFSDGTNTEVSVASLFEDGSLGGAQTIVTTDDAVNAPTISIIGASGDKVASLPGAQVDVTNTDFDVLITGTPGATFELLQVDTRLFIATGAAPFDVSPSELPFYANEALSGQAIFTGTFDGAGQAIVSASLLETQGAGNTPDGGLNYLVARTTVDGVTSTTSDPITVKLGASLIYDAPGTMVFDGTAGSVLELAHDPIYEIAEGTVAFSFNANTTSGDQGLFTKDANGFVGGGNHFALYLDGNVLTGRFQNGSSSEILTFGGIQAGTDYEVAATFGADGIELWVDGNLVDSADFSMDWRENVEAIQWGALGWRSDSGATGFELPFNGTITDKQVYAEPLTASQIAALASGNSDDNIAPVAVDDVLVVDEDGSGNVDVVLNDTDADGDAVTVAGIDTDPANGTAAVEVDGTVTYTPDADFNGEDSFVVTVSDGRGGEATSTVTVTVNPVADDPVVGDDDAATLVDTDVTVSVLDNDVDPDGGALTITATTDGADGTVTINADGTVSYTPTGGFIGEDTFTYTVADDNGGAETTATVTITVQAAPNVDPVAVADDVDVDEDGAVTFQPGDNDTDANGDTIVANVIVSAPSNGAAVVNANGTITYTPNSDFNGDDSFEISVTDGNGGLATSTVNVTVAAVNDDSVAVDDEISTVAGVEIDIPVLGNDTDIDGDSLIVSETTDGTNGTVEINAAGGVTYIPDAGFVGEDTFTYTIDDQAGGAASTASVTVTVLAEPNTPPVASEDDVSVAEDGSVTFDPAANDTDANGDTVTASVIVSGPSNGEAVVNANGTVTYTPDADYNGDDSFVVQVIDGNGGTDTATTLVTVTPENDGPTANDDSGSGLSQQGIVINLLGNDFDIDGDDLMIDGLGIADNGSIVDNGDGTVTYTSDAGFEGTDTFSYTVTDGDLTAQADVSVDVASVPTGPTAVFEMLPETTFDGTNGSVIEFPHSPLYDFPEGTVNFTFNADDTNGRQGLFAKDANAFGGGGNHLAIYLDGTTLKARYQDGSASVTLDVITNVQAGQDYDVAAIFDADGAKVYVDGQLEASDDIVMDWTQNVEFIQWGGLGWRSASGDDGYELPFDGTIANKLIYDIPLSAGQVAALHADGPINGAPTAAVDVLIVDEDSSGNIDVTVNDNDPDGDTITVSGIAQQPDNGIAVVEANGTVTYLPEDDFNGTDSFVVSVTDGNGGVATSIVTVTVNPVNDDPNANDDSDTTVLDTAVIVDVLDNDSDPDGNSLTITAKTDGTNGSVTINGNGTVTYTPNAGFVGDDSFTYTINDQNGGAPDTATVDITVLGAPNTPPVAVADAKILSEDGSVTFQPGDNDTDVDGDTVVAFAIASAPSNGEAVVNANGTVTYTPNPNFFGEDSFDIEVSDGNGGFATATAVMTVSGTPDDIVAQNDTFTTDADTSAILDVLANDSSVDGLPLEITSISADGIDGIVSVNANGTLSYDPNGSFATLAQGDSEDVTFSYTLTDGTQSETADVTVTIEGIFVDPTDLPIISGDDGNDVLRGTGEAEQFEGFGGTDKIFGGGGDDIIIAGAGDDFRIEGGAGADTFVFNQGADIDGIRDFEVGIDTLQFNGVGGFGDLSVTDEGNRYVVEGPSGYDTKVIVFYDGAGFDLTEDAFVFT